MNSIHNIFFYTVGTVIGLGSMIFVYNDIQKLNSNNIIKSKVDRRDVLLDKTYKKYKDNDKVF